LQETIREMSADDSIETHVEQWKVLLEEHVSLKPLMERLLQLMDVAFAKHEEVKPHESEILKKSSEFAGVVKLVHTPTKPNWATMEDVIDFLVSGADLRTLFDRLADICSLAAEYPEDQVIQKETGASCTDQKRDWSANWVVSFTLS